MKRTAKIVLLFICAFMLFALPVWADQTFTYTKTIQNSAGLAAEDAIVKAYRGVKGTLYATDTCNAAGTFSFTLSDSFAFYRIVATNWDVNAPWRPMEWVQESATTIPIVTVTTLLTTDSLRTPGFVRGENRAIPFTANWGATAVALCFHDLSEYTGQMVDTLEKYNAKASIVLPWRFLSDAEGSLSPTSGHFTISDVQDWYNRGHEIVEHSPSHWFPAGQTEATYQATIDSSMVWHRENIGVLPRCFCQPGGDRNPGSVFDATWRQVIEKNFDYGSQWAQQGWSARPKGDLLQIIHGNAYPVSSRFWLPQYSLDDQSINWMRDVLASYACNNTLFAFYGHTSSTVRFETVAKLTKFLDSLGVPMVTISELADLHVSAEWPRGGNLFANTRLECRFQDPAAVGLNSAYEPDGVRRINTHGATWDYYTDYDTPCSDEGCVIRLHGTSSEDNLIDAPGFMFPVAGIENDAQYKVSFWHRQIETGEYTDIFHVATQQLKDNGYSPVVSTLYTDTLNCVRGDSTWKYWSHTVTAEDSTDQISLYIYAGVYGGSIVLACPRIEKLQGAAFSHIAGEEAQFTETVGLRGLTGDTLNVPFVSDSLHIENGVAVASSDQTGWLGGAGTIYFHGDSIYVVKEDLSFGVVYP